MSGRAAPALLLLAACGEPAPAVDAGPPGPDAPPAAIVVLGTAGASGDVGVSFRLAPADGAARDVALEVRGACGGGGFRPALTTSTMAGLAPGDHALVWHSWDDAAGCEELAQLRLVTDRGEQAIAAEILLANVGARSGFAPLPQDDQGINPDEEAVYSVALAALLADPSVDFVATRRGDEYEVAAARGTVVFTRQRTAAGTLYPVVAVDGANPIARQDPWAQATLADELAAGANPNAVALPDQGYPAGDPRLSFIEPEDDSYPFGYERLAAYFDHPGSADFYVNRRAYAHAVPGHLGDHGSLNSAQSRSPLLLWGAGVAPGEIDLVVREVDIAPTIASLLGLPTRLGVDERGVYSRRVRLGWQDGHEIAAALDGTVADHVIVIVSDALAHTELADLLDEHPELAPNLAAMRADGAWIRGGSISNFPSVTYPAHNVIGSGMWSGHHGLVDNTYVLRATGAVVSPISQFFLTEQFFDPVADPLTAGESLHQAVHRVFGVWTPGVAAYTASLNDPSVKDADTADLEQRDRSGVVPYPPTGLFEPAAIPEPDLGVGDVKISGTQESEKLQLIELYHLLTGAVSPPPRYVIINFPATDVCGHGYGAHADKLDRCITQVDAYVGVIRDWLSVAGLQDTTAIVFTSDHATQLGDPTRTTDPLAALDLAGVVRAGDSGLGVYLP